MGNPVTYGWLVYRVLNGDLQVFGLMQTEEKALADVAVLPASDGWLVKAVPFLGWGYVAPGVFGQNGPAPLKIVE